MTPLNLGSRPISAVVPPGVDGLPEGSSSGCRIPPPPLPRLPSAPLGARTEYGLSTVGANGRLSDRSLLRRLGWHPGIRLDVREDHGLIVVRADPRAVFRISGQGFLLLPSTLRRWCRLVDGDRVLLVADPDAGWLVIHPPR